MARRKNDDNYDDAWVEALERDSERYFKAVPGTFGLFVRVFPSGKKSFYVVGRDLYKKQISKTIGTYPAMKIAEAKEKTKEVLANIAKGEKPIPPAPIKPDSFAEVAEDFLKRHVNKLRLISEPEIKRIIDKHLLPVWREREFIGIRRSDVVGLLDQVEDDHGPRQADMVLSIIGKMFNWFATRDDEYRSPLVKGMRRWNANDNTRDRVLSDDEIKSFWSATGESGAYGALCRLLLVTAQRRDKVATLSWNDLDEDGVWRIPAQKREKNCPGELPLPQLAIDIIAAQPKRDGNPFVFHGRSQGHLNGWSKAKRDLDKKMPGVAAWRLHDLRRSARSLMSRAGVNPDHAEHVLGHKITGVKGVYDRYQYTDEKGHALKKLAALIQKIVTPPRGKNVVDIKEGGEAAEKAA